VAYVVIETLRRLGLKQTDLAQVATIRLKLLKIAALIQVTVRKVWVARRVTLRELFAQVYAELRATPLRW
jgi:hypothetical protein